MFQLKPRVKEEWTTSVNPKSFWIAVLAVAIPLCIFGFYTIEIGHVPDIGPGIGIVSLAVIVPILIVQFFKHGRRAFPLARIINILGFLFYSLSFLLPPNTPGKSALFAVGSIIIGISMFSTYFQFGKRKDKSVL